LPFETRSQCAGGKFKETSFVSVETCVMKYNEVTC